MRELDNYFVVSADRQTILGFEMTANLRDTSPLRLWRLRNNQTLLDTSGFFPPFLIPMSFPLSKIRKSKHDCFFIIFSLDIAFDGFDPLQMSGKSYSF